MEWLIPATSETDPTMPAAPQQQFNLAVNLSTEMLRSLKQNEGLQGPLKAHLYDTSDLVGATAPAPCPCSCRLSRDCPHRSLSPRCLSHPEPLEDPVRGVC